MGTESIWGTEKLTNVITEKNMGIGALIYTNAKLFAMLAVAIGAFTAFMFLVFLPSQIHVGGTADGMKMLVGIAEAAAFIVGAAGVLILSIVIGGISMHFLVPAWNYFAYKILYLGRKKSYQFVLLANEKREREKGLAIVESIAKMSREEKDEVLEWSREGIKEAIKFSRTGPDRLLSQLEMLEKRLATSNPKLAFSNEDNYCKGCREGTGCITESMFSCK